MEKLTSLVLAASIPISAIGLSGCSYESADNAEYGNGSNRNGAYEEPLKKSDDSDIGFGINPATGNPAMDIGGIPVMDF